MDIARHVDLRIGVAPIINLECVQKIHRDKALRGYSTEAVIDTTLRCMPDYINYILPQFSRTHVNFQRVPAVDTSNPLIANDIPTLDESFLVIRFDTPRGIDFPYLLSMLHDSFMSRPNTIVCPGGKMGLAMQIIFTPMILQLMDKNAGNAELPAARLALAPPSKRHRNQRNQDDADDHQAQVLLDPGQIGEKITGQRQGHHPADGPEQVEKQKTRVVHRPDAGNERREGAQQGQKTGNHQRLAAVPFVEKPRLEQRVPVEKARILPLEDLRPDITPNLIIEHVAERRRRHQRDQENGDVHPAHGGQPARHEQQRIPRQERRDDESRLTENDGEQNGVDPCAILLNKHGEMFVEMQHDIGKEGKHFDKEGEHFHEAGFPGK
jgi:hypothetical protein